MSKAFITKINAFTPLAVPGSIFWLDAVDVNATGTNPALGSITTWKDKISGITLTATSANTLVASSANGLPGVRWTYNGGNGYGFTGTINSSYAITSGPIMICCVINYNNQASFANWLLAVNNAQVYIRQYQNNYWLSGVSGTTFASGTQLITAIYNGASSAFFVNGTQLFTGNPSTTQWTGIISVGSYWDGTTNNSMWSGDINEMVTVSSTVNQQKLEGYLAQKWGLVSSLPTNHPGRSQTFYTAGKNPGIAAVPSNIVTDVPYTNYFPLSIGGCQLWLDGADSTTVTGNVTSIREKANNVSLSVSGTVTATTIGSQSSLSFGGAGYLFGNVNSLLTGTSFVVFKTTAANNGYTPFFTWRDNAGQANFPAFGYVPGGNLIGPYTTFVGVGTLTTSVSIGNSYITSYSWSGTTTNVGFNGAAPTSGTQPAFTSTETLLWIAYDNGAYTTVNIGEILLYNSVLTTNQRQSIEGYLAWKWGLQSTNLPITHPYYSAAPLSFNRPTQVASIPLQLQIIPQPWTPLRPLSSGVLPWHWFRGDVGMTTTAWTNFGTSKSNASNVGTITLGNYTQGGSQAGGTNNTCIVSPSGYWR